jgi:hypothetical protein
VWFMVKFVTPYDTLNLTYRLYWTDDGGDENGFHPAGPRSGSGKRIQIFSVCA